MKFHYLLGVLAVTAAPAADIQRPNILVIMGEAQGWASMSVPLDDREPKGSCSDFIRTPNLDSLAERGMRFSDFYAASPRCTPTRAAFFTGRSPAALHMTFVNEGGKQNEIGTGDKVIAPPGGTELPAGIETVATLLQRQGYATAHFGKWHAGHANPSAHGYEENDGANGNGGPDEVESPNPKQCFAIANLGMDFMTRQVRAGKPFYLHISEYPARGPDNARPETVEAVKQRLGNRMDFNRIGTAAADEDVDASIGLLLTKLKELGATANTLIIYTADHGAQGQRANGMLKNGKGTVWEGGLRVPLVVAGPGIKSGAFSHVLASTVDLLPTIAELAGLPASALPAGLEGGSLAKVLRTGSDAIIVRPREEFVVHFPHYDKDELGPASAIYLRNFKLIRAYELEQPLLFDLGRDVGEQNNLAAARPEVTQALQSRLSNYLSTVKAGLPTPNPNYDPAGQRSGDLRGGQGGKGGKGGKKKRPEMRREQTEIKPAAE